MRRRDVLGLVLGSPVLALAGCASKPTARVSHAEVRGISPMGLGVTVFLRVFNDNSFDIQIRRVRGSTALGLGRLVVPVDVAPNQWLTSDSHTMVPVPLWIPWPTIPGIVAESVGSPIIPYRMRGRADVTAVRMLGIERDDFPVDEQGTIPRQVMIDAARTVIPLPL